MKKLLVIALLFVGMFAFFQTSSSTSYSASAPQAVASFPAQTQEVLALGDSLTVGYGPDSDKMAWRGEFIAQAKAAGTDIHMNMLAVGGWSTADVLPQLAATLLSVKPDLVIVCLGTNDSADPTLNGFEARYSKIIATILDMSDALIEPCFIQYSAIGVPFATTQGKANDAIFRIMANRGVFEPGGNPRFVGWADLSVIPWTYLSSDGVHLTPEGYKVMGRQIYRGAQGGEGWTVIPVETVPLDGHRP